jgi:hypothetical protein
LKLHISKGNSKLGRCPNVSLTPIASCPKNVSCARYCYARALCVAFKSTRNAWDENLALWLESPGSYFSQLHDFILSHAPEYFRYHAGGDIPDKRYLDMMNYLATQFPYTRFMAFTKTEAKSKCENLVIIHSFEVDSSFSDDSRPSAYTLRQGQLPFETFVCPGSCVSCGHRCWYLGSNERVTFYLHGNFAKYA